MSIHFHCPVHWREFTGPPAGIGNQGEGDAVHYRLPRKRFTLPGLWARSGPPVCIFFYFAYNFYHFIRGYADFGLYLLSCNRKFGFEVGS